MVAPDSKLPASNSSTTPNSETCQRGATRRELLSIDLKRFAGRRSGPANVTPSIPDRSELVVVGGGPGGYTAAIRGAQFGIETTLVEQAQLGGTCLHAGCIPSKALLSATGLARRAQEAEPMGVRADPDLDREVMVEWTADVVSGMARSVEKLCRANGVTLVEGQARFTESGTLAVDGDGIGFDHAILATGSQPVELPNVPFDRPDVLDAADALTLDPIPPTIAIVGGGYIGAELATALAAFHSDVTLIEAESGLLPAYERDLVRPVERSLQDAAVDLRVDAPVTGYDGERVSIDGGEPVPAEAAIVAVGREPATDDLGLAAAGIEVGADGFVRTDEAHETTAADIYAIGDVAGEPLLAHKAAAEGRDAAASIAGEPTPPADRSIPAVVYTEPTIATVGHSPDGARKAGLDPRIGEVRFATNGRAATRRATEGFVRLVARDDGTLVGAQLVGPEVEELVAECALAIDLGATFADLAHVVHPHPTCSEAVMEAAENGLGRAIHSLNR
jgi:dihydrolipoamide dehydrogenase